MDLQKIISDNLKGYRKKLGITQEALAAKAKMGSNHLARIERGEEGLSLERWAKISKVFGIPPYLLLKPESYKEL